MTQPPAAASLSAAAVARSRRPVAHGAVAVFVALAGPAAVTLLALGSPREIIPALLYVLAVLLAAAVGGRGAGLLAAGASILPFSFFFVPPTHDWALSSDGALALAVYVATAIFGGEVLARQRGARTDAEEVATSSLEALDAALRLQGAATALVSARTPQEVLDAVLVEGVQAADARGGLIATLSEDGEWLEVIASRGYDPAYIDPFRRFPVDGDFPLSEAVRSGEGVFIGSEAERDARYPELVGRSQPGHALVCVPLLGRGGRALGGLVFSFSTDQTFPPQRRALKLALARQAALALERVRLAVAEEALRERLAFLDEATALLTSSLDLERTAERLASLAVRQLADWCAIDVLVEETGEIRRLFVAHQDPERRRWAEELRSRARPTRIDDEFDLTARTIRTGEPQFLREVPQELLDEAARRDPEAAAALEHISIRSAITIPLRAGDRPLGALSLVAEDHAFDEEDFLLARRLGDRAAIAIENARLYQEAERRADAALALAYVGDGVVLLDRAGHVRYWNAAAAAITGTAEADALGRPVVEVLPGWQDLIRPAVADGAASGGGRAVTLPLETVDGDRWLAVTRAAFDGGVVYALRDVTDERALERTRSDFVTTASHELRTPLAAVYGAARTLRRTDLELEPEQRDRFLEIIESETERLTTIVSQILLAGQVDDGRLDVATRASDLRPLVESALDSARLRAPEDVELRLKENGGPAVALADVDKLRQVIVNLLDNAVKYSPDGGEVTVELAADDRRVTVTVRDRGLGIPAGEHDRIFEKFYRLDPGQTRGVGGSGLGLYISRELVSQMGGVLTVDSRPGEGAAFVVELPAA